MAHVHICSSAFTRSLHYSEYGYYVTNGTHDWVCGARAPAPEETVATPSTEAPVSFSAEVTSAACAAEVVAPAGGTPASGFPAARGPFAGFFRREEELLLPRKLGLDVPVHVSVPLHAVDMALPVRFLRVFGSRPLGPHWVTWQGSHHFRPVSSHDLCDK